MRAFGIIQKKLEQVQRRPRVDQGIRNCPMNKKTAGNRIFRPEKKRLRNRYNSNSITGQVVTQVSSVLCSSQSARHKIMDSNYRKGEILFKLFGSVMRGCLWFATQKLGIGPHCLEPISEG